MTIELTIAQRRLWWHGDEDGPAPEDWHVSADIWQLSTHDSDDRHVADLSLTVAPLGPEPQMLDAVAMGEWALAFLADVHTAGGGGLPPDLDWVAPGPERVVVIRRFDVVPAWRGLSAGTTVLASALSAFVPSARLAIARCSVDELSDVHGDSGTAEIMAARWAAVLGRVGFRERREVYVADLRAPALARARQTMIDRANGDGGTVRD